MCKGACISPPASWALRNRCLLPQIDTEIDTQLSKQSTSQTLAPLTPSTGRLYRMQPHNPKRWPCSSYSRPSGLQETKTKTEQPWTTHKLRKHRRWMRRWSEQPSRQIQEHQASEQEGFQPQPLASEPPGFGKVCVLQSNITPCHLQRECLRRCSRECPGQQMTS